MQKSFTHRAKLFQLALISTLLLVLAPTSSIASAQRSVLTTPSATSDANLSSARLTIKNAILSRVSVVVPKGGHLTLANSDNIAYRIKIGATLVVVPAKGSKTIPLPQRGTFSITCSKAPSLRATLIVK